MEGCDGVKPLLIISATPSETTLAKEMIAEMVLDAIVIEATAHNVVEKVQQHFNMGAGVVVARGKMAALLKNQALISVVEVVLSGQDMALLLSRACQRIGKEMPRIALVGQRYMFSNPEPITQILKADVTLYYLSTDEELHGVIAKCQQAKVDLLIGDEQICAQASKVGLQTMLIGSARESMLSAIRTAVRLSEALLREQRQSKEISSLIQYSSDAIIRLNKEKEIVFANPRAEKAIGHLAEEVHGTKLLDLEELVPSVALSKALDTEQNTYATVLQFGHASYVANIVAVDLEDQNEGWIISMQEFAAIDDLDERIRQERYRRGFVAHAKFSEFPSRSPKMKALLEETEIYAQYDVPILISGEPRLPKSRLAQCIHNASLRRRNPYVSVDLSTIPPDNQFDVLFGRQGSGDVGLVSQAHKGTLFLLDVHTLVPECQQQILSILRNGNFSRKNTLVPIPVSVRLICSTFSDLLELAKQDKWMFQLANTLLGLNINMPPVRETPEDVPEMLAENMAIANKKFKKEVSLSDEAVERLCHYPWPANLRDIEYFCLKATMLATEPEISLSFVRERLLPDLDQGAKEQSAYIVTDREELLIRRVLKQNDYNRNLAAEQLGMARSTLWRKMKKYHIE